MEVQPLERQGQSFSVKMSEFPDSPKCKIRHGEFCIRLQLYRNEIFQVKLLNGDVIKEAETDPSLSSTKVIFIDLRKSDLYDHQEYLKSSLKNVLDYWGYGYDDDTDLVIEHVYDNALDYIFMNACSLTMGDKKVSRMCVKLQIGEVFTRSEVNEHVMTESAEVQREEDAYSYQGSSIFMQMFKLPNLSERVGEFCIRFQVYTDDSFGVRLLNGEDMIEDETEPTVFAVEDLYWKWEDRLEDMFDKLGVMFDSLGLGSFNNTENFQLIFGEARKVLGDLCVDIWIRDEYKRFEPVRMESDTDTDTDDDDPFEKTVFDSQDDDYYFSCNDAETSDYLKQRLSQLVLIFFLSLAYFSLLNWL